MILGDFSVFKDKVAALDSSGNQVTYDQLDEIRTEINKVMQPRSLVIIYCTNTIGCFCGYLSILNNDCVPLLVSVKTDEVLLKNLINTYEPAYYYLPEDKVTSADDILYSCYGYSLVKSEYKDSPKLNSKLALLLTTSGSVGSPKLVRLSQENIRSNAEAICEYLEISSEDRPITTLPMNYTYGLSVIHSHILKGATILLIEDNIVSWRFWNFFESEKATSIAGVPYTYEMLDKIHFYKMKLPSLRTMTQAGGKLSPELHSKFASWADEKNIRFYVMYGQTEATARMAYLPYKDALKKCPSIGIAIPGGKITIEDESGNEINQANQIGELVYEGKNVALGYAEIKSDLAEGDVFSGKLYTGDMVYRDEMGYHYICGRKKRFLKLYGNRVNLDETQNIIKTQFATDCVCTGTDEKMSIYVTDESILEKVKKYIVKKTNLNSKAFEVLYIAEIPKNEAGKTLYSALK